MDGAVREPSQELCCVHGIEIEIHFQYRRHRALEARSGMRERTPQGPSLARALFLGGRRCAATGGFANLGANGAES